MKKVIRLTESDLHKMVKKSVNRIIKESVNDELIEELENHLSRYSSSFNVFYDESKMAYGINGNDDDLSLWAGVFFAQSRFNLKLVASGVGIAYFRNF